MHTCNYYCDRPECLKAQRDELRDKWETIVAALQAPYQHPITINDIRSMMTEDKWFLSLLTPDELLQFARMVEAYHGISE